MIDPSKALAPRSRSNPKDELTQLLDRARQERFRLLQLLQDARTKVPAGTAPEAAPTASATLPAPAIGEASQLLTKLDTVHKALESKLDKAREADQRLEARFAKLATAEMRLTNFLERLNTSVGEAQQIEPVITAAVDQAATLEALADKLQLHSNELTRTVDQRLADQTQSFYARLDDHADKLTQQQIDEQQAFADAVSRQKQNHLDQLARELADKRAELFGRFEQTMQQAEQRMSDRLDDLFSELDMQARERFEKLREGFEEQTAEMLNQTEGKGRAVFERIRHTTMDAMSRSDEVQRSLRRRLDESFDSHLQRVNEAMSKADDDMLRKAQKLDERLAGLADLFDHQVDTLLDDMKQRASRMLDRMAESLDQEEQREIAKLPQIKAA